MAIPDGTRNFLRDQRGIADRYDPTAHLCVYDPRSDVYAEPTDPEDYRSPREDCSCERCFSGRDGLAVEILRLQETLDRATDMVNREDVPAEAYPLPESREAIVHDLKIAPVYYEAIMAGVKTWEVRRADRDYQPGDVLRLRKWGSEPLGTEPRYLGAEIRAIVAYRARLGSIDDALAGYVGMSIVVLEESRVETGLAEDESDG